MNKEINLTIKDRKQLANQLGKSVEGLDEALEDLLESGLIKKMNDGRYDTTPYIQMMVTFTDQTRQGIEVDIKKLYYQVTGKVKL